MNEQIKFYENKLAYEMDPSDLYDGFENSTDYIALDEDGILAILIKMVKQRKDAASQYEAAGRQDLLDIELAEIVILHDFLPKPLSEEDLDALILQAMVESDASGMQDMGKVMSWLKPKVQGRADMGLLSGKIKAKLNS